MFERYTDRARRVIVLSQEAARALEHNYIGTEHILLGLIEEGEGVAATVLTNVGLKSGDLLDKIVAIVGRGAGSPSAHIPFTPRTKRVLELSLREGLQLGHNYVGTEHLLLGLLREGEGIGAQALTACDVDLATLRKAVIRQLSGYADTERPESVEPLPAWNDLLGSRVRVWDGQGVSVRAEGEVIGVITAPTLVIRCADGQVAHESTDLPIDWCREEWRRSS